MNTANMILPIVLVTAFVTGCATTRTAGEQLDDATVTARVGHRLTMDPDVPRRKIDVDTLDGIVTLRGDVPDDTARSEAVEVASRTRGVVFVRDQLAVRPSKHKNAKPDGDVGVTTRVNNRLIADPDVHAANVDIDTYDGIVTLSGIVENEHAREEAERLARETKGVKAVHNELRVPGAERLSLR